MPSFWDLLPAGAWPTQPFIPPFDPTQAGWPPNASPQWTAASPSTPPWTAPLLAGAPLSLESSGSPSDSSDSDRLGARRAYDFAMWAFGPPSTPQIPQMRAAAFDGASPQDAGDPAENPAPPDTADPEQPPALAVAGGNPHIERQGARGRATAAARPPALPIADRLFGLHGHERYQFFPERLLRNIYDGLQQDPWDPQTGTFSPQAVGTAMDVAMLAGGRAPRAPLASPTRALPPPSESIVGRSMGIPQVSAKSVPPAPVSSPAARSEPLQLELPLPALPAPPEGLATVADRPESPGVGPSDLADWRARSGVPTAHTAGVARTNVPGMEDMIFEGGSPQVRKKARLPPAEPDPIDSPFLVDRDRGHAEQDLANQFIREVRKRGLQAKDLKGYELWMYLSKPSCTMCRSGLGSEATPGVLKQLSTEPYYPDLTIHIGANVKQGTKPRGPTHFSIRNGNYVRRSDRQ